MDIKEREKLVLNAVIDHYIRTGDTISSITLVKKYNVKFSSATIRNVMVTLETLGYLDKTHASSGRILTTKGYRYYIDSLLQIKDLTAFEKAAVSKTYFSPIQELAQLYYETVELLGNLTQTAVFLIAYDEERVLLRIDYIYVSERKVILALIFEGNLSRFEEIRLKNSVERSQIETCIVKLNARIAAGELTDSEKLINALNEVFEFNLGYYQEQYKHRSQGRYVIYGIQNLIYSIEDLTSTDTLELVSLLNSPVRSANFFKGIYEAHSEHVMEEQGIKVILGEEVIQDLFSKFGFVLKKVKTEEKEIIFGIVGPRRMQYEKAVSLLDYVG
ncbi:MAG: heat-inducible transcriptional repressor HrcA, partial [Fusobacteria bacterium]|nr:heat-inducible transcriptional repressor HrcA [Fusobacteriota bacterium]